MRCVRYFDFKEVLKSTRKETALPPLRDVIPVSRSSQQRVRLPAEWSLVALPMSAPTPFIQPFVTTC